MKGTIKAKMAWCYNCGTEYEDWEFQEYEHGGFDCCNSPIIERKVIK
jgi:hypothetical protein